MDGLPSNVHEPIGQPRAPPLPTNICPATTSSSEALKWAEAYLPPGALPPLTGAAPRLAGNAPPLQTPVIGMMSSFFSA